MVSGTHFTSHGGTTKAMRTNLNIYSNIHEGETCVIIGNGPSLRLDDLERLSKYITFGSNQIYRLPFTPTYYSMVDRDMIDACLPLPLDFKPLQMFIRAEACIEGNNPIQAIIAAGFSRDIDNFVIMGGTVTYVLFQIAYFMGFKRFLLTGVDHNYPYAGTLKPGKNFEAGKKDIDHFECADGKPYFREGLRYNAPEMDGVTQSYLWINELFGQEDLRVVNLTRKTDLEIFEKMDIDEWLTTH